MTLPMNQTLAGEGGRYLAIGLLNTAVGMLAFYLCLGMGLGHQLALACNFIVGGLHSYLWNRFWTFRAAGSHLRQLSRFGVVTLGTYLVNAALLEGLVRAGIAPMLAQMGCLFVTTALGFFAHRLWSFR